MGSETRQTDGFPRRQLPAGDEQDSTGGRRMSKRTVARWQDESGKGLEHLTLEAGEAGITVESTVLAADDGQLFVAHYALRCDRQWRVREARIALPEERRVVDLRGDGQGNWTDGAGASLPDLAGAIDVDITV